MEFIKKNKTICLLILFFVILLSFYLIREFLASREIYNESYLNGEDYIMNSKVYGVNEYSLSNVTIDQMVDIYFNDFKNNIYNDVNYAYQLLNEEYRNLKFGNIDNFISYVNSLNSNNITIDRYSISDNNDVITVYTENDIKYIFKIISVMEYEVYLDDYTVEI